ncbi:MAG TPA: DUF983 domain-containing protein [Hyphomicrobiaceae bacterium]|jgi:uncharacterized protein (DUF983 family)|nr:DUF983 domain-containing protein [Hyphomicrobiaceae bacterium]
MARDMIEPDGARPRRTVWRAMLRGFRLRCPNCGRAPLFQRYLKVKDVCALCGEELFHHRADDAPAYFTIFIVGHIVVAAFLAVYRAFNPPDWVHFALWVPLTVLLSIALLPRVKGAIVGLQWALYMHGFETAKRLPSPPAGLA